MTLGLADGQRRLLQGLLRPHAGKLAAGIVCLLLLAGANALYAALTGPLLRRMVGGEAPLAGSAPLNSWALPQGPGALAWVALVLLIVAGIKGLANLGQILLLQGTAERVGTTLRERLYRHLLQLPLAEQRRLQGGDLLARLLDDVRRTQEACIAAPLSLLREGLAALALLAVATAMAPGLTLVAAVALPLAGVVIARLGRQVKLAASRGQAELGQLAARAGQGLAAVREVKACGAEEREAQVVAAHGQQNLRWQLRRLRLQGLAPLYNELAAAAALGGTLIYAAGGLSRGTLAPERFISFFAAVLMLYRPIKELGRAVHTWNAGQASVGRVLQLLALAPEEQLANGTAAQRALPPLEQALELQGVGYSYDGRRWPLRGVNLQLRVGQIAALAGPSGAGKSTLVNLACGLERPQQGRLLWDGRDLAGVPLAALRAQTALVPQQPLLLEGTLADNLRYGAPQADEQQLQQVLLDVGLPPGADQPRGLQTPLGSAEGLGLSVGEAQRLAVARALLRQVRLLVLDEPSSALDRENEQRLIETLQAIRQSCAVLIVAHSPALLAAADLVYQLAELSVVDQAGATPSCSSAAAPRR